MVSAGALHRPNTANQHRSVFHSANLPNSVKSQKVHKQEQHLAIVQKECSLYNDMVHTAKQTVHKKNIIDLSARFPISRDFCMHYSFDFAQQVHYLSDPLQPGPVYFLLLRICCESLPRQVSYLADEGMCSGKRSNSVLSYLHHFFANYGLGEYSVDLRCDNCSGQNKNKFLLDYCYLISIWISRPSGTLFIAHRIPILNHCVCLV